MTDTAGPSPIQSDNLLLLDDVKTRFEEAGLPRDIRTLQRYCEAGALEAFKEMSPTGLTWYVHAVSVDKRIEALKQLHRVTVRHIATETDTSGFDALKNGNESNPDMPRPTVVDRDTDQGQNLEKDTASQHDEDRQRPTQSDIDVYNHPYVKRLEDQVGKLEEKYESQVKRTEDIQLRNQEKLIELQRMTTIGQSKALTELFLKVKNFMVDGETVDGRNPSDALPLN